MFTDHHQPANPAVTAQAAGKKEDEAKELVAELTDVARQVSPASDHDPAALDQPLHASLPASGNSLPDPSSFGFDLSFFTFTWENLGGQMRMRCNIFKFEKIKNQDQDRK